MTASGVLDHIERLIAQMTLDEKVGQLTMLSAELIQTGPTREIITPDAIVEGRIGSLLNLWGTDRVREVQRLAVEQSRLKIPLFFGLDVVNGFKTIFPIAIGESCAFDPGLWERTAHAAAQETAAVGVDLTFAPMIDVARDPRWGRTVEGPGEDTYVASRFAEAKVRGFQAPRVDDVFAVGATAKHLAGYGAVQAGREYASVDLTQRQMREIYLPPFRAAVEAGVVAIMPAFTDLDGTPMTASTAILRDLVRAQWGFSGVMVSDYGSVAELVVHGVAEDLGDAAALALKAGVDIDMMGGGAYTKGLPLALQRGKVTMEEIDEAVRRVLRLKAQLGLFADPYRRCGADRPVEAAGADAKRLELAFEAACRSFVLLKNKDGVLPLLAKPASVAVIGPLADAKGDLKANPDVVVEGLRAARPEIAFSFAPGCDVDRIDEREMQKAVDLAKGSDSVVLCLGETPAMSGEASSRARPGLPDAQCELARAVIDLGRPVIVLLFSGRPLVLPDWLVEKAQALMAVWFPGTEAGRAIAAVLSGAVNPVGRLSMTWPVDVGQIPIFYGERPSGRPAAVDVKYSSKYLDMPNEPRFAFGHGLSYGEFALSGLKVDRSVIPMDGAVNVEVDIENLGAVAGEATIFFFTRDPVASVARPQLELKGFRKIALAAHERGKVGFRLTAGELRFVGADLSPRLEPGAIDLHVGQSAVRDMLLSTRIELKADA